MRIQPTIGRVVLVKRFFGPNNPMSDQYEPGLICYVHGEGGYINVGGHDKIGNPFSCQGIRLYQPGEELPEEGWDGDYACWMDYQVKAAEKQAKEDYPV